MNAPLSFAEVALPLANGGWRPFPGRQKEKIPAMRGWNRLNHEEWDPRALANAIARYQPAENYCCCLAVQPELVMTDLDIVDAAHAEYADRLADEILGHTPLVRIGLHPKQLRIYRNVSNIRSRKLHPLEIFAGSGQVVGFGWHARAGRPYRWRHACPLDLTAHSGEIPLLTQARLDDFTSKLFKVVPRRELQNGRFGTPAQQTIGERLRMLTTMHGNWRRAAAIVLGDAAEGYRNDTAWAVIGSAASRGFPHETVWQLFEEHFTGWEQTAGDGGLTPDQLGDMIERANFSVGATPSPVNFFRIAGVKK